MHGRDKADIFTTPIRIRLILSQIQGTASAWKKCYVSPNIYDI